MPKRDLDLLIEEKEKMSLFIIAKFVQNGYKTLNEGELVEFELYQSERGMQAKHVVKSRDNL